MNAADLRSRLDHALAEPQGMLLQLVSRRAAELNLPVYLVGGFVRDLLLGLQPGDFDFVVEGGAPALARVVARELGGEVTVHAPFATATWFAPASGLPGRPIDFASARTETYPRPAALPVVKTPAPITADLNRRDITINAIALRVDGGHYGELLDPHHGQADLAARLVRVLHPRSFVDDPTRMFRAVRYAQRLGFGLAPETQALIPGARPALAALTGDRARHELELVFREARAPAMLEQLHRLDILAGIHPALRWSAPAAEQAARLAALPLHAWRMAAPPEPDAVYLVLMLQQASPAQVVKALSRLNVGRAVYDAVQQALALHPGWVSPSQAVAALDDVSELAVIAAYVLYGTPALSEYLARWRFVGPATRGDDLIAAGLAPGPDFKRILWTLRAAWLDGQVSDPAGEQALLRKMLDESGRTA